MRRQETVAKLVLLIKLGVSLTESISNSLASTAGWPFNELFKGLGKQYHWLNEGTTHRFS